MKNKSLAKITCEGKSLKSFCVARCYASLFIMPPSRKNATKFIITVITKFFLPQYMEKLRLRHTPVKHVDHELDEKIPFKPSYVTIYMYFINYWVRAMSMLELKFGVWYGSKLCSELLTFLKNDYEAAYDMYRKCMTTTYRPPCDDKKIKALRAADPHYLCVPSLHIAIIATTYAFFKMLFDREDFTAAEKAQWTHELYDEGLAIARSVLYLKQHSVNCIPAALYMVCKINASIFTISDAVFFIEHFLEEAEDISKEDRQSITNYINFVFERFLLEGTPEDDWTVPVVRWLKDYQPYKQYRQ